MVGWYFSAGYVPWGSYLVFLGAAVGAGALAGLLIERGVLRMMYGRDEVIMILVTYGVLLILLFSAGVSVSLFHVPAPVMISRVSGNQKGKGMSFYMTGGELARTIGPRIAVGAVSLWGLEGYYPIMLFGILASIWLYFRFQSVPLNIDKKGRVPAFSSNEKPRQSCRPYPQQDCRRRKPLLCQHQSTLARI